MHFVGLDLAWGEKNQTGVAAIDSDGRLLHVGAAQDDASIIDAIAPFIGDDCLVAFDAPLIVKNPTGYRPARPRSTATSSRSRRARARRTPTNPNSRTPRGARLAAALDLDMDPASSASRRAIEVYPHPATVVLFELEKTLKYKTGRVRRPPARAAQVDDADRGPRRRDTAAAGQPQRGLGGIAEDGWRPPAGRCSSTATKIPSTPCCAPTSRSYWYHRPDDVTIYGDFETGYIVTPSLPPDLSPAPRRRVVPPPIDELHERLSHLEVLLADAQLEVRTIRERLYRL